MSQFVSNAVFLLAIGQIWLCNCQAAVSDRDGRRNSLPRVVVDSRVELISIIFRLAGNPEYTRGRVPQYSRDMDAHFGPFKNHPIVKLAANLRRTRGISYDACMSMAVHMGDPFQPLQETSFSPLPKTLDQRWTPETARQFLAETRRFIKQTSYQEFHNQHRPLYNTAVARMESVLDQHGHLDWFDAFFGPQSRARFTVILAMLNGGNCYGPRSTTADGNIDLFCVLGVWKTDSKGLPTFDSSMLGTLVHEFCHSYTNVLVDRHLEALRSAGEKMYPYVAATMRRQAYGNWQTIMYESMVRASVVRYVHRYDGPRAASSEIRRQVQRGFAWIGGLSELLGKYEQERDKYRDLNAFMPRVIDFFDTYAESFVQQQKQLDARRPHVESIIPANGAANVDPGLQAIVVVFDRPMRDGSWSLVGSGPHFPKVAGKPSYDKKYTTWTVPIKLQPSWKYSFMLNSGRFNAFRSQTGVPLEPVTVSFKTGTGE